MTSDTPKITIESDLAAAITAPEKKASSGGIASMWGEGMKEFKSFLGGRKSKPTKAMKAKHKGDDLSEAITSGSHSRTGSYLPNQITHMDEQYEKELADMKRHHH